MSLSPSTLPRSVNLVHVKAPRTDRNEPGLRERLARLQALDAPLQWQLAVLAHLLGHNIPRELVVWREAAQGLHDADVLLDDILALPHCHRLPWFEHFARLLAPGPVEPRHALIGAARRLMVADGMVSEAEQLQWVALRHLLAGSAVAPPTAAHADLADLQDAPAHAVCVFSGFLSHLLPAPEVTLDLDGLEPVGQGWYDSVTAPWEGRFQAPPRERQDIDASLRALRELQALPWLLRPVLVRRWFDAARVLTDGPQLHPAAADALRLTCTLLDSPVPPELGRQYTEVIPTRH